MAVLGLLCCGLFSSCSEQGLLFFEVRGLLIAVASLIVEHRLLGTWASVLRAPRLQSTGPVVKVHGLSCFVACRLFLAEG